MGSLKHSAGVKKTKISALESEQYSKIVEKSLTFRQLLLPDFLVVCEDFVRGVNNDISIIKTVDFLRPDVLPISPARFVVMATFFRMPYLSVDEFTSLAPECRLIVQTPSKKEVEIGPFPVSTVTENDQWLVERLIVDLSGSIEFTQSGPYLIRVEGRLKGMEFEVTHRRLLPVLEPKQKSRSVMTL